MLTPPDDLLGYRRDAHPGDPTTAPQVHVDAPHGHDLTVDDLADFVEAARNVGVPGTTPVRAVTRRRHLRHLETHPEPTC